MNFKEIPSHIAFIERRSTIDLFIRIKKDFRLFAARGAHLSEEQFNQISSEKVRLFIKIDDSADGEVSLDAHLMGILTDPGVNPQVKAGIAYAATVKTIQDVFRGTNSRTLAELKKMSGKIVKLIVSDNRVIDNFITLTSSDPYTLMHSVKVGIYGTAITISLFQGTIDDHKIEDLSMAYFLHDIGMTRVPGAILNKEENLTQSEWETVKRHPVWGQEKLRKANYLDDEATGIVLYHHERCDGSGYPLRKAGDEIPVFAKICAIADTFESLTSGRPFSPSKSPFEALRIMQGNLARGFDPKLFKAFIVLLGPGR